MNGIFNAGMAMWLGKTPRSTQADQKKLQKSVGTITIDPSERVPESLKRGYMASKPTEQLDCQIH